MNMNDFQPNSHKYKQESQKLDISEKKLEKVIEGAAKTKKKTLSRRFIDTFFNENAGDVKTYLVFDVLIPAIKDTLVDLITKGAEMLFFGEATRGSSKKKGSYVSYGASYRQDKVDRLPPASRGSERKNIDDVIFETRGDAEKVLDTLCEALSVYGSVSIADFYDLADISSEWTDNNYGWMDLRGAKVIRTRAGYMIDMPKPININ